MKQKIAISAALLLILASLAGCASGGKAPAAAGTAQPTAETNPPEMTASAPVEMETEAPTEPVAQEAQPFAVEISPVITGTQTQVTVTTVDEFLAAIAPDTEIVLDAALLDLSEATGYGETEEDYYYWYESFDGPELHIRNVSNLTIRGAGESHDTNVISSVPRYAHVLAFENCGNVYAAHFTAGHTKEPGYCAGGVLLFQNCQDVLVEDCGLFGCGTFGVTGRSSKNMQIVNNEIYECSYGGLELFNCYDVNVDGNTFRDLGGSVFWMYDCQNITCNGQPAESCQ